MDVQEGGDRKALLLRYSKDLKLWVWEYAKRSVMYMLRNEVLLEDVPFKNEVLWGS